MDHLGGAPAPGLAVGVDDGRRTITRLVVAGAKGCGGMSEKVTVGNEQGEGLTGQFLGRKGRPTHCCLKSPAPRLGQCGDIAAHDVDVPRETRTHRALKKAHALGPGLQENELSRGYGYGEWDTR